MGGSVDAVLELDGDVRILGGGATPRGLADATVVGLVGSRGVREVRAAVLLFAPVEGWRDLLPGQRVQARIRIAEPRPGDTVVAVVSARGPPTAVAAPSWWQAVAGTVRRTLAGSAGRVLPPRPAGLLPGLVVGDTSRADPVLEEDFRSAGLSHLTAVSGANVAIVLAAVLWPLRRRAVDRRAQLAVGLLGLAAFVVLARPSASVLRAAAMGAVTLWALASGRPRAAVPALAAASIVLLLVQPDLARAPGFALSVAATAAIVLLAPGWSRRLRQRGWPSPIADALAVSAAAGLATAPLVAALSGTVSLVSIPANLLAAPAVPAATVLGLGAAVLAPVCPPLADLLVWAAGWPVRWLVVVAERAAGLPDAAVTWPAGTGGAIALGVLLLMVMAVLWRSRRSRALALVALAAVLLVGWPLRQVTRGWPADGTVLVACDVGQGDALVIPTAPGAGILVDAGPEVGPVDHCLDRLGIDTLPLVLLSHLDADHVGGLAGALSGRDVGVVATGPLAPDDSRSGPLDALLGRTSGTRGLLEAGDRRRVGNADVEVLAPSPDRAVAGTAANDLSMVVRVTVHGLRLLFTGDLGAEAENRLVRDGIDLTADVLKVPHHGSADADPEFLAVTHARVALVSVGADNTYGHPTPRLLQWLRDDGMRVHRTDRQGDLAITGAADDWAVVARGGATSGIAAPGPWASVPTSPARDRRIRVTRCGRVRSPRRTDLATARRHGGGGAPPGACGGRRPRRGDRAPPRHRGARADRARPAGGPGGRRPGAVAVRRAPDGRGAGGARGGRWARRRPRGVRQGPGPRHHARAGPRRRQAQRGAAQGVPRRRCGSRRVPEASGG
jgi:competence protein ComEC